MSLLRVVTCVVRDAPHFGLMPGYCILGLRLPCQCEYKAGKVDHTLKTWPEYYEMGRNGKMFELRRDDREPRYATGQMIELVCFKPAPSNEATKECGPQHKTPEAKP